MKWNKRAQRARFKRRSRRKTLFYNPQSKEIQRGRRAPRGRRRTKKD